MAAIHQFWIFGFMAGALVGLAASVILFWPPKFIWADMKTKIGTVLVTIPCIAVGVAIGASLDWIWH